MATVYSSTKQIHVPEDLHFMMKLLAQKRGQSLQNTCSEALRVYLKAYAAELEIRTPQL